MDAHFFKAYCDVEMGDEVEYAGYLWKIIDIAAIHYCSNGNVEFRFKLQSGKFTTWWLNRNKFKFNGV